LLEFEFDFNPRYRFLLRPLGVHAGNSYVGITDDDEFLAKFGRWQVRTPLANIAGYQTSGDYKWWKAIGIRGSLADHGLTFGSNTRQGLCVEFIEKIPALVAGPSHPGLTVTVADVSRLAAALESRGIVRR
jgi:hypothetical protein